MKLRNQILGLGLVGLLMALLVGGIGLFNTGRLATSFDQSVTMSVALQKSQEADMMHDAIRGDVLLALLGAINQDTAQIAEAQTGLKEHGDNFNELLNSLQVLPISDEVKSIVQATLPLVKKYIEAADATIKMSATDESAAKALVPDFQKTFVDLEKQMAGQADAIEKDTKAFQERAKSSVASTQISVGIALAIAAVILILSSITLAQKMAQPMVHAVEVAQQLAQGNLAVQVQVQGNAETQQLLSAMAGVQTSFNSIVQNVKTGAESVATASAEIAQGNNDLSARTEQQASALEETAASMEQLSATVKQNADSARTANQLAQSASSVAVQGGVVVNQVVETMKGINEASRRIADIISVIDGIAFQTNILALNAAVEAARAGEQGRGFAVVASEVRSLAGRSAEAAKEIKSLIGASVERVDHGTALVDQAGTTMSEVVSSIKRVTDIMGEISSASDEQAVGVAQVGEAVTQMDQTTQQNAALVEEMAAAASSLKGQAQELVEVVAVFNLGSQGGAPQRPNRSAAPAAKRPAATKTAAPRVAANAAPKFAAPPPKLAKPAVAPAKPTATAKAANTGADDDWETF